MERIDIKYFIEEDEYGFDENKMLQLIDKYKGKKVKLHNISKELVEKLSIDISKKDELGFMYGLIPILANVDITISEEEFREVCEKNIPSFTSLFNTTINHFIKLYKSAEEVNATLNKLNDLKLPNSTIIPEKTTREKYDQVVNELEITSDLNRYKELLALKGKLQLELENE